MKKFFLLAMAAVAMTFTACKTEPAAPAEPEAPAEEVVLIETDSIAKVIEAADSTQLSSLLTTVQEQIENLKNTDPAKAKEYLATIQNFLKENADKIKAFAGDNESVNAAISALTAAPADAIVSGLSSAIGAAGDAVEGAVEDAKDAAADKAEEVKEAAKEQAGEAVDAAANKAKDALGL